MWSPGSESPRREKSKEKSRAAGGKEAKKTPSNS